jgi:transcriptional regulator with XRE-family HTH domain
MADQFDTRPELGSMLRAAREARGWSVDHVQVALGFFTARDGKDRVLSRTQLNRIEDGGRALTTEEAWRFVEIYPELDALALLLAANAIDEEASPEFRATIETEAARRRETYRQGGNRRRSERAIRVVAAASAVVARQFATPATASARADSGRNGDCTEAPRVAERVAA